MGTGERNIGLIERNRRERRDIKSSGSEKRKINKTAVSGGMEEGIDGDWLEGEQGNGGGKLRNSQEGDGKREKRES